MIRYGSVCSGIEAASTAWHTLGWQPVFFSEIEPFPCSVLATHWPHVHNLGDLTQHESWNHESIDLLVGGTPCQAFSVAGLREGLADPRGNLTITFLALVKRTRPRWVVWENVPGVLSDRTNAFGHFLSGLAELGYGWAYRVLDAQYFGVAQRRRRVFVVACAGADWRRAAAVLFEPDCLRGNPPPSRQAGQRPAGTISSRTTGGGGLGTDFDLAGGLQPVVGTLNANGKASGSATQKDATGRGTPLVPISIQAGALKENPNHGPDGVGVRTDGVAYTIEARAEVQAVAFAQNQLGEVRCAGVVNTLNTNSNASGRNTPMVQQRMQVRRLTPRECERLQGFPDDHTLVPHRGKPAADGPRYKAIGNSMAVPVMAWIGRRIQNLS